MPFFCIAEYRLEARERDGGQDAVKGHRFELNPACSKN